MNIKLLFFKLIFTFLGELQIEILLLKSES